MSKTNNPKGLRKRHSSRNEYPTKQEDLIPSQQDGQSGIIETELPKVFHGTFKKWQHRGLVLVHLCALLWMFVGFVLKAKFHTGDECDMTYSRFQFFSVPIKTKTSYQLYKFMDGGDPRHGNNQHLQEDWCGVGNSESLISKRHIVLYIPGHWGSHSQARSIGAHGIQMAGRRMSYNYMQKAAQALQTGQWNGQATDEESFVFDVYAADFAEQGTALHGKFLLEQTEFVAQAVVTLAQKCQVPSITIVAHSVGGLVARAVPLLHAHSRPFIQNIITLATPHSGLPYAQEKGVHDFLSILTENQNSTALNNTLVVSISGGLRDELIPPEVCHVNQVVPYGISVLAHEIMPPKKDPKSIQPRFGMDHKCIAWCHGVLSVARKIIFIVASTADTRGRNASRRLDQVRNLLNMNTDSVGAYQLRVKKMRVDFQESNGFFKSVAIDSAMVYHLELWIGLYVLVGALQIMVLHVSESLLDSISALIIPVMAAGMGWMWSDRVNLHIITVLLLSFVEHGLFLSVRGLLEFGVKFAKTKTRTVSTHHDAPYQMTAIHIIVAVWLVPIILIQTILCIVSFFFFDRQHYLLRNLLHHRVPIAFVWSILVLLGLALKCLTSSGTNNKNKNFGGHPNQEKLNISFVALLLPTLPCVSAGKIMFIVWRMVRDDHYSSDRHEKIGTMEADLIQFFIQIILPVGIRLVLYSLPTVQTMDGSRMKHAAGAPPDGIITPRTLQFGRTFLFLGLIFWHGPRMFMVGKGYVVGLFLACLAWLDVGFFICERCKFRT